MASLPGWRPCPGGVHDVIFHHRCELGAYPESLDFLPGGRKHFTVRPGNHAACQASAKAVVPWGGVGARAAVMHVACAWRPSLAVLRRRTDCSWPDLGCRVVLRSRGQVWLADWGSEG
eukprot:1533907-Alexandrium_andersonii.AAC.1